MTTVSLSSKRVEKYPIIVFVSFFEVCHLSLEMKRFEYQQVIIFEGQSQNYSCHLNVDHVRPANFHTAVERGHFPAKTEADSLALFTHCGHSGM